ncbi:MAG: [FeFe] hydrogenase H-cluster radical SAM maturase HydE [Alistipes sp.]|nr:[FeFe] hydrogenase H-cluster radical SAM maturase HydE [Alistipes sp.]
MRELVERLVVNRRLDNESLRALLTECTTDANVLQLLRDCAVRTAREQFGLGIYIRGLIEVSSYCRCDCLYCGLRRSNRSAERYRLTHDEIMACCREGYKLGFRTFVLQGGEDGTHTDRWLVELVRDIRQSYPDVAITLSLGERSEESYRALYEAGANRYLLRHEAANADLYDALHPTAKGLRNRLECLEALKRIGYQVGMGMMIGVKGQTIDDIVEDLQLIGRMQPQMVGIGPFMPHSSTPLGGEPAGDLRLTLAAVAITRLMLPSALIPSTTALATLSPIGRLEGILSGANVVMPNLSPSDIRAKYAIYENKASWGKEAAEGLAALDEELKTIGYHIDYSRGDFKNK